MFNITDKKISSFDLKIMKSGIFSDLEHFFSTRVGGDTPAPLNTFTLSAKDFPTLLDYEIKNKKIVCEILGGSYERLISPNQQHTDNIAVIKKHEDINKIKGEPVDGIITNLRGYPVCLVFADCVPILLFDEKKKVLACIHAGWKGTAKGIVKKAVNIMREEFSCLPEDINAAIGAAICEKCFEISNDVARQLAISLEKNYDNIFIENNGKIHADLKQINKLQMNEAGVQSIDVCRYCTSCDNKLFYSYRADNRCTGRHGLIAMIKE